MLGALGGTTLLAMLIVARLGYLPRGVLTLWLLFATVGFLHGGISVPEVPL